MNTLTRLGLAICIGLTTLGTTSCKKDMVPYSEAEPDFDASSYAQYAWITEEHVLINVGKGSPEIRTKRNEIRIRAAVEKAFADKGYQKAPTEDAQFIIAFSIGADIEYELGGSGEAFGFGYETEETTRGTLTVHVFDKASGRIVWKGWGSKKLNPEGEPDSVLNEGARLILTKFPDAKK